MNKKQKITYRVLLVILSLIFLSAAIPKLLGLQIEVTGFAQVGLPVWFMYCIGLGELFGAIGIWTKTFFRYAYEGLFLVLAGAIILTVIYQGVVLAILPIVTAIILGFVVSLNRKIPA
jgi:hypothetical protein